MENDAFEKRRRSLEEAFFAHYNQELLNELHAKTLAAKQVEELKQMTGIKSDDLVQRLVKLGVNGASLSALSLFPMTWVAWSDGRLDEREKDAVLRAAHDHGLDRKETASSLLNAWLSQRPTQAHWNAWKDYVQSVKGLLTSTDYDDLKEHIMATCKVVAEVAGGFAGLRKTSPTEKRAIEEIESVF